MDSFRGLNRLFDSERGAEFPDIKIVTGFLRNPILEIFIKNLIA